jgi:small-conductance mechanosensitive channel
MMDFLLRLQRVFDAVLFRIGDTPITLSTLLSMVLVVFVTFWASRMLRLLAQRALSRKGGRPGVIGTVTGVIHYAVLITGFAVALSTAGIDLTALFAAGAIFAIGLGFAMQSIAENFVAGVILLAERAIKPGDVLQVEDKIVKVIEMGIRASIAQTRDGEDMIIPNSILIQTTVKNFTLRTPIFRIRVPVGVIYASDMALVRTTLQNAASALDEPWVVKDRDPQVIMTEFGDHSVNWELALWINDPWEWRPALSAVHEAIWRAFKKQNIVIAFPQLDVHLDAPVVESFERISRPAA